MKFSIKNPPNYLILYTAASLLSVIYILWRAFFTLPRGYGGLSMTLGVLLLLAEILGYIETAWICRGTLKMRIAERALAPSKPKLADLPPEACPHIDVLIATCHEPVSLLKKTIWGCQNMDYPDPDKVHIYVCDDGNRAEMRELCRHMNVGYIGRSSREGAKAGNYNHALSLTSSPLIATFDSDMIPRHDFLLSLVPFFFGEDGAFPPDGAGCRIGFVQSPQSFYNHDLFQFHLYSEGRVPNEQDFFFRHVQPLREMDNAVIYAGSNTILLRKALQEAGGFYTGSITEDLATGMLIQSQGYVGAAVPRVYAGGLSPMSLSSLFKQRERWARGCIQTMKGIRPLTQRGLDRGQRISYLLSFTYWYTPYRRLIFMAAPILHAVFGIPLVQCTLLGILLFWLPQAALYHMALYRLCRRLRTSALSNIYDTILCPGLLRPVLSETLGFSCRTFSVTDKKKRLSRSREDRKTALCHGAFHVSLLLLTIAGILRCFPPDTSDLFILLWLIINGYYLWMALLFIIGRTSKRGTDRISVRLLARFCTGEETFSVETTDLSEGGAAFTAPSAIPVGTYGTLYLADETGRHQSALPATVVRSGQSAERCFCGASFLEPAEADLFALYGILHDRIPPAPDQVRTLFPSPWPWMNRRKSRGNS